MKTLRIRWQRLLDEAAGTCGRCAVTEGELEKAVAELRESLSPSGIDVVLEKDSLDFDAFMKDPSQSNRIWIDGRPLEEWLEAQPGQSPCCGPCGDEECRTIELEGERHEAIPESLIVKAGLLAASRLGSI